MSVDCKLILNSLLQRINDAVQETINSLETQINEEEIQTLNKKSKENINFMKIKNNHSSQQKLSIDKKQNLSRNIKYVVQTANIVKANSGKEKLNINENSLNRKGFSLLAILDDPHPKNNTNPKSNRNDKKKARRNISQSRKNEFKKMETIKELLELLEEKKDVKVASTKKTLKNSTYTVFPVKDDYRFCSSEKMLQSINFENESDDEKDGSTYSSDTSDDSDTSNTSNTESSSLESCRGSYAESHATSYATNYGASYGTGNVSNYGENYGANYGASYGTSYGTSYAGSYGESPPKTYAQNFSQNNVGNNLQSYNNSVPQQYATSYAGSNALHFVDNCTENRTENNMQSVDYNTKYYLETQLQNCIDDDTDDDELQDDEQNFVDNYTDNGTTNNEQQFVDICKIKNLELNKKEYVDNYTDNYAENYVKTPVCAVSIATDMENITPVFTNCVQTSPNASKVLKVDKQNSPCFTLTPSMTSEDISSLQIVCDSLPLEFTCSKNCKKRKGFFSKLFRRTSKCSLKKSKAKVPDSSQTVCVREKLSTISYDSSEPDSEINMISKYQHVGSGSCSFKEVNPKPVFTKTSRSKEKETSPKTVCPRCNKLVPCFAPSRPEMKDTTTSMSQPVENIICKKPAKAPSKKSVTISTSPIEVKKKPRCKTLVQDTSSPSSSREFICKKSCKPNLKKINKAPLNDAKTGPKEIICPYLSDEEEGDSDDPQQPIQKQEESVSPQSELQKQEDPVTSQSAEQQSIIPEPTIKKDEDFATLQLDDQESEDSIITELNIKEQEDEVNDQQSKDSIISKPTTQKNKETDTARSVRGKSKYSMIPQTSIKVQADLNSFKSGSETASLKTGTTEPRTKISSKPKATSTTGLRIQKRHDDLASLLSDTETVSLKNVMCTPRTKIYSKPKATSTTGLRTNKSTAQIATGTSDINIERYAVQEKYSPTLTQNNSFSDSAKVNYLKSKSDHQCKDCACLKESFNSLLRAMLSIALKKNERTDIKSNPKTISDQFSNGTGDGSSLCKTKRKTYYDKDEDSYRMNISRRKNWKRLENSKDLSSKIKNLDAVLQDRLLEPYLDYLLSEEPLRKIKARNYFSPCGGKCGKDIYHCVHNNPLIYSLAKYLKRDRVFNDDISDYLKFLKKTSCSFGGVHVNRYFRC